MLEVKNLVKVYSTKGGVTVRALDDVSVKFPETGMVFLLGRSGSGKSTLLNVAGGLDKPDSGEVIVKGKSSKSFSGSDFDSYRNTCVGFVFQEYNILNEFTIEQNISLALQLQNKKNDKAAVNALLEQVDLKGFGKRKPNTLSGGQKQRVAIARALIKEPEIIMADEPTGALDSNTGKQVLDTLKKLSKNKLVIIVSHDRDFAEYYGDRIIELKDGKIIEDVTKSFSEPQSAGDNVQIISNDTVSIKEVEKITEADVKNIVEILKKTGGEAIITANKHELKDVKRVCRINEDGSKESFTETTEINVKEYDGKKTKFIKSRLPVSHAFKIGASGLKAKPIRLIFTILLSVIAFAMFGIVSTFMLYDESYSVSGALQEADYPFASVETNYLYRYKNIVVNLKDGSITNDYEYEGSRITKFSQKDIDKLNDNNLGLKFAGVYGLNGNLDTGLSFSKSSDYFTVKNLIGFSDCGEQFLIDNGFELKEGKYPVNSNEIAVSNYIADLFNSAGKTVLGSEMSYQVYSSEPIKLKIVGVYDLGETDSRYNELKDEPTESLTRKEQEQRDSLIGSLSDMLQSGFYTVGFVSEDFYKENIDGNINTEKVFDYTNSVSSAYINGIVLEKNKDSLNYDVSDGMGDAFFTETIVKNIKNGFEFFDLNGNKKNVDLENFKIDENEVYVNLESTYDLYVSALNKMVDKSVIDFTDTVLSILSAGNLKEEIKDQYYDVENLIYNYRNCYNEFLYNKDFVTDCYIPIRNLYDNYTELVNNAENVAYKFVNFNYILGAKECTVATYFAKDTYMLSDSEINEIKNVVKKNYKNITGYEFNFDGLSDKRYYKDYKGLTGELTVAGYFTCNTYDIAELVSDAFIKKHSKYSEYNYSFIDTNYTFADDAFYDFAITKTDNSKEQIAFMLSLDEQNDSALTIKNSIYEGLSVFTNMITELKTVFLIIGCVVGVFAALMLINFISTSISYKRKEIGILRAVGARGTDVFKIFFAEAFIIAMICFVLASVSAGVVCSILNNTVSQMSLLGIGLARLLDFGAINVATVFVIAIGVSAIATFFPVNSASRKSPVDSIRAL